MIAVQASERAPELRNDAVLLRRFTVADSQAFADIHRDPLNIMWTGSDSSMDAEAAARFISGSIATGWEQGTGLRFAVVFEADGVPTVIGTVSLQEVRTTADGGSASVGIKMLPGGRGNGRAAAAISLLCDYAFSQLGLTVLHWLSAADNTASVALATRSGFAVSATIPGYCIVDSQLSAGMVLTLQRAQWEAPPSPPTDVRPVVPVLRGESVVLRALRSQDAAVLVQNCRDADAIRWTTVPLDYTLAHAEVFINEITVAGWRSGQTLTFAVADAGTDELLGTIDLQCKIPGAAAIGINFGPQARGTGAAEAAARLLVEYAFSGLNLSYLHWHTVAGNWGSRKLAWKLGFRFDGEIRGDYNDRGNATDRWVLSLAAQDARQPQAPWTGPAAPSR